MRKSVISSLLVMILMVVAFFFPTNVKGTSTQSLGPGKMTYVIASEGSPLSVDPALAYDVSSDELIANVYDTLIFFKGTDPSSFVPWLASSYSISPDGQIYTFQIRTGVRWHDPAYGNVTAADVEYSLQRVLVRDYTGGPAWMFWFPIFGQYAADLADPVAQGKAIDNAITSNATYVTIRFQTGLAYLPFLGILAQPWGSILCRKWCIDHGDWDPAVDKLSDGTWVNAHNPFTSPLDIPTFIMMGSGAFKLNYLNAGVSWSILRNVDFWGGWSNTRSTLLGLAGVTSRGYVDEIVKYCVDDYATRISGFTGVNPIYDEITVPTSLISSVWQLQGVKAVYPLPQLGLGAMFFNFNTGVNSPYIGNGAWGELGVIPTFFSDVHVRKAIAYSFDWSQYIMTAYLGEAEQVPIPLPTTLAFFPDSMPKYELNVSRAIAEWQTAWGGLVWTQGFRFTIVYNIESIERQTVAYLLKAQLEAENPKFHVDVVGLPIATYLDKFFSPLNDGRPVMPLFINGWLADFPDADDFTGPFISSSGYFGFLQSIHMDEQSELMDNLITWGAHNTTFEGRNANYQQLWNLYIQEVPSLPLVQPMGRRFTHDWVHGWYYNPVFPGVRGYSLWKENIYS